MCTRRSPSGPDLCHTRLGSLGGLELQLSPPKGEKFDFPLLQRVLLLLQRVLLLLQRVLLLLQRVQPVFQLLLAELSEVARPLTTGSELLQSRLDIVDFTLNLLDLLREV